MEDLIRKVLAATAGITVTQVTGAVVPVAAVPDGVTLRSLESLLDKPVRISGMTNFREYPSFIDYVKQYKQEGARIFVSPDLTFSKNEQLAICYLDFPAPGKPVYSEHMARLLVQPSLEYRKLMELDNQLLSQDDFARRLRDVARFCTSLPAADLLEIANKLTLTSKGDFKSITDDITGAVSFAYDVQVKATLGAPAGSTPKTLEIPTNISFHLPLLLGGREVSLDAELLYRIPEEAGGKIKMGLRLPNRLYDERDLLQALVQSIGTDTGVETAVGDTGVPTGQAIEI